MDLIPLNLMSSYTFLSSAIKLDKFFAELKKRGINQCAIADYQHLMGFPQFDALSKEHNISPLFGMKIKLEDNDVSLYVLDEKGYQNLIQISHYISKNRCKTSIFLNDGLNFDGLACIISSNSSIFEETDEHTLSRQLLTLDNAFNKHFYIGIECYEKDDSRVKRIRNYLEKHPFKSVAFPSILYINKQEGIKIKLLDAIKNDYKLNFDLEEDTKCDGIYYFRTESEWEKLYTAEEINATHNIHPLSSFVFSKKRGTLLHFEEGVDSEKLLRDMCFEGLKKLNKTSQKYTDRLNYELGVIHSMGYDDYFLLVQDYVGFSKKNKIITGPGRGSSAGSLVSYALNITELDPLENGLLFERFLNKDRVTMPDIDVDFEGDKRMLVVKYIQNKYGDDNVAQIATIHKIKAKQALNDIGRIYDLNPLDIKKMSSLLLQKDETLMESYKNSKAFKELVDDDIYYKKILALATRIEGYPRQRSIHASGVVINQEKLDLNLPTFYDEGLQMNITQYEMNHLEEQGFLKMDILSLINLSSIRLVIDLIKKNHGIEVNFSDIDYNDPKIFSEIINKNLTMGVFQIESIGMNNAISILKPNCFEDIVSLLALYRPGPMDQINDFAERKHSSKQFSLKNKVLEDILKNTYGKIIYQEQIIQIGQRIAGFSASQADLFRRAISKKNHDKLAELEKSFSDGCLKNGYTKDFASKLFRVILKFANYGFNKSHAAVYAVLTCKMAWLKYYYPQEFYIALLSTVTDTGSDKFNRYLDEFKKLNIKMSVPNINLSTDIFIAHEGSMVMPFTAIKGITAESVKNIIHERNYKGEFTSLLDFVTRMIPYSFQENQLEKLIKSGCFDQFLDNRAAMLDKLVSVIKTANIIAKSTSYSIFEDEEIIYDTTIKEDKLKRIFDELELLGVMVSYNPIQYLKNKYENLTLVNDLRPRKESTIMGIISSVKKINTKNKKQMAFISINDEIGTFIEGVVFTEPYEKYYEIIEKNKILVLKGYLEEKEDKKTFIVREIEEAKHE